MIAEGQRALEALLPHRAPMLLLDAIALKTSTELIATSNRGLCAALLPGAPVSGMLSLELMAQAAAVFAGLAPAARDAEAAPAASPGMLLGGRKLELNNPVLADADRLLIGIEQRSPLGRSGLAKFAGTVWVLSADQSADHCAKLLTALAAQPAPRGWLTERLAAQWLARSDLSVYLPA